MQRERGGEKERERGERGKSQREGERGNEQARKRDNWSETERGVLGRVPSGTVGASHRKPLWAAWSTMYYDPGRALGIKPWLESITPMPLVTLTMVAFNG